MSVPFTDWTREEKDEFAKRRMDEMKLLNEKYKQRHAEVERDRMKAEAKNSSVTSSVPKEKSDQSDDYKAETEMSSKPKVKEREWDRGKSNLDLEDWTAPKGQHRQPHWRGRSDNKQMKKFGNEYREDHWRDRKIHRNKDSHDNSSKFKEFGRSWGPKKMSETKYQGASNYRNDSSFTRQRSRGYNSEINNHASYRPNNYKSTDSRKKKYVGAEGSASQSPSDSEMEPVKQSTKVENDRMWRDGSVNEVRHRQIRVEKWIDSINSVSLEDDGMITPKLEKEEYQDKSWTSFKVENSSYGKGKCSKTDSKITDPEGIWEDLVQESCSYPFKYSWKDNPSQSASTPYSEEKPSRKNDYNRSSMQRDSNKQWKSKSHSKNQSSSEYSGTYENQAYKKQSDRMSSRKKPDNHSLRKGKYIESKSKTESRPSSSSRRFENSNPSGDNCDWSSHEFDDSILVKIKSHTVKRTVFNSFRDTEKNNIQTNLPDNETEITGLNPTQVSENIQRNSMGSSAWDESGIWDDCDYDDSIQNQKSVEVHSAVFCQESSSQAFAHSEMDNSDCDNYQIEDEDVHSSNENEYANEKGNQSEIEDHGSIEHTGIENSSEFSSLNVESPDKQGSEKNSFQTSFLQSIEGSIVESHTEDNFCMLNIDDNNNGKVKCITHPEVSGSTAENLENVEILSNKSMPLEVSSNSETQSAPTNNFNAKELHDDICVVSKSIETAMEQAVENNSRSSMPTAEIPDLLKINYLTMLEVNEKTSMEENGKEETSMEENGKEETSMEENGKEETCKEKDGKEATSKENIAFSKEEDENIAFSKEEDGNIAVSKEEDRNIAVSKEEDRNIAVSKEEDENEVISRKKDGIAATSKEEENVNAATTKEDDGNTALSKEEEENIVTSKEEKENTVTSKEEKENTVTSKEGKENTVTSKEGKENTVTSKEKEENTVTSKEKKENTVTSKEKEENTVTSKKKEENTVTSKRKEENIVTSKEEEGNTVTSKEEVNTAVTSKEEDNGNVATSKADGNAATSKADGNAATSKADGNATTSKEEGKDNKLLEKLKSTPDDILPE